MLHSSWLLYSYCCRAGYGRVSKDEATVEIYRDNINGLRVYKCPFCDWKPIDSDIRFRKHLKQYHPNQKTLLKDSLRPPEKEKLIPDLPIGTFLPQTIVMKEEGSDEDNGDGVEAGDGQQLQQVSPPRPRGRPLSVKAARIQALVESMAAQSEPEPEDAAAAGEREERVELLCAVCCSVLDLDLPGDAVGEITSLLETVLGKLYVVLLPFGKRSRKKVHICIANVFSWNLTCRRAGPCSRAAL